ncbi:hypothetical protein K438DRAFT_1969953 [Mycena galopus ATCC 62051]|nr:hypothetical protein K438DRAFT_1969953 [Mycena galopus ATCC 62051]
MNSFSHYLNDRDHAPHQLPFAPPPRRTPLRIIKSADQQGNIFLHKKLEVGFSSVLPFLFPFSLSPSLPFLVPSSHNYEPRIARPHHRRHLRARWGDDDASGSATRPFSAVSKPPPALRNAVRSSRACAASSNSRQTAAGTASSRGARLRGDEVSSLIVSELLRGDPGTTLVNKHACMCHSALVDPTGAADLGSLKGKWAVLDAMRLNRSSCRYVIHLPSSSSSSSLTRVILARGFENLEESAKDGIVDELLVEGSTVFSKVAKSQWGSYCVEHILAHAPEKQPSMALEYFLTGLLEFATNEQGSKSVVKALKEGGKATLDRVVQRMCEPTKCARRAMIVDLTLSLTGSQLIAAVLPTADKDRRAALCDGNAARLQDRLQGYLAPVRPCNPVSPLSALMRLLLQRPLCAYYGY